MFFIKSFIIKDKFKKIISKISSINYDGTMTLETDHVMKDGQYVYLSVREKSSERREMFIKQFELTGLSTA